MLKIALFLGLALGIQLAAAACPMQYIESESGGCYLFASQEVMSRSHASDVCTMYSMGQPVIIESDAEFKEIVSLLNGFNSVRSGYVTSGSFNGQEWVWNEDMQYTLKHQPRSFPEQFQSASASQEENSDTLSLSLMVDVEFGPKNRLYAVDLSPGNANVGVLCEFKNGI